MIELCRACCDKCKPKIKDIKVYKDERERYFVMCPCGIEGAFARTAEVAIENWNETMRSIRCDTREKHFCFSCGAKM